jgi:hypothetical protein
MSTSLLTQVDMARPARLGRALRAAMVLAAGAALLAGCTIKAPLAGGMRTPPNCNLTRIDIAAFDPVKPGEVPTGPLIDAIGASLKGAPGRPQMLILSGGSEHGAYGAGFLDAWAKDPNTKNGGMLPDFQVVTGVSTGALQSSAAFAGYPKPLVFGYTIDDESDLLTSYSGKGRSKFATARALIRHGALANLEPARGRLLTILNSPVGDGRQTLLEAVAAKAARKDHPKLYVGLVDLDTTEAVAIDMSELAMRWAAAPRGSAEANTLAGCYADAVIASSSAPMAAPPVFIDGKMYVDGGVRFGLFANEAEAVIAKSWEAQQAGAENAPAGPLVYVIVNAQLDTQPHCRDRECYDGKDRHLPWSFDQIAQESEAILANQIYRLSKERLVLRFGARSARMPSDADLQNAALYPPADAGLDGKNCGTWRAQDEAKHPIQFHPKYMECIMQAGRYDYKNRANWAAGL